MYEHKKTTKVHPHLPSGRWEGFYSYQYGPNSTKYKMRFHLTFHESQITGSGADDIGYFTWQGEYDTRSLTANIIKSYSSHEVHYQGWIDENGIWGNWNIDAIKGGFHIWPTESFQKQEKREEALAQEKRGKTHRKQLKDLMHKLRKGKDGLSGI